MRIAIIGSGATGAAAAYKAKIRKHDVVVFRHLSGATSLSSGTVDIFPFSWSRFRTLKECYKELHRVNDEHPLIKRGLSMDDIRNDLVDWSRFLETGGVRLDGDFDRGIFLLNHLGMPKWSVMGQRSLTKGRLDQLKGKVVGLIHTRGSSFVHVPVFLRNVHHLFPRGWKWLDVPVDPPAILAAPSHPFQMARLLDHGTAFSSWIEVIKRALPKNVQALAFPAILGVEQVERNRELLESVLGIPCFELAPSVESVPGMRLYRGIHRALMGLGVGVRDEKVQGIEMDGEKTMIMCGDKSASAFEFDRTILATGRFLGGGLQMHETGPREALAGLPVGFKSRNEHTRNLDRGYLLTDSLWCQDVLAPHPVHRAGAGSMVPGSTLSLAGSIEGSGAGQPLCFGMAVSIVLGSRAGAGL